MILIGLFLLVVGMAALCWLLFNLAVFALPVFAALSAGMAAMHAGAGPIGATATGALAGVLMFYMGRLLLALAPSRLARGAVALLFAIPAAIAGYYAAHGLAGLVTPAEGWRQALAIIGGVTVGLTALARMAGPLAPEKSPQRIVATE